MRLLPQRQRLEKPSSEDPIKHLNWTDWREGYGIALCGSQITRGTETRHHPTAECECVVCWDIFNGYVTAGTHNRDGSPRV